VPDAKEEEPGPAPCRERLLLEHAQDLVSVLVGMVLIVLAGAELVLRVISFFADMKKISIEPAGINLLDRVLLVLILVEIVHTVVLSLRAHHLSHSRSS